MVVLPWAIAHGCLSMAVSPSTLPMKLPMAAGHRDQYMNIGLMPNPLHTRYMNL
jgi:hypothetical protein